jgi:hypothetical protein
MLTCRLAVRGAASDLEQKQASGNAGGFIAFPSGTFALAPQTVTRRAPEQVSGWTYRLGRWLPAAPRAVAPDSLRYAWIYYAPNRAQDVHVADATTAQDRVLASNTDLDFPMWGSDGLYLVHHLIGSDSSHGLIRLDAVTGSRSDIPVPTLRLSLGWEVSGGAAWATDFAPQDPVPDSRFGQDRLQRYDLKTGQLTTWFYRQGHPVRLRGFDGQRRPVIAVDDVVGSEVSHETLMLLTSAGSGTSLLTTDHPTSLQALADAHGLWLVGREGIYLAIPGQSAQLLSGFRNAQAAAGPCDRVPDPS